jgi:hypothetical protein
MRMSWARVRPESTSGFYSNGYPTRHRRAFAEGLRSWELQLGARRIDQVQGEELVAVLVGVVLGLVFVVAFLVAIGVL